MKCHCYNVLKKKKYLCLFWQQIQLSVKENSYGVQANGVRGE